MRAIVSIEASIDINESDYALLKSAKPIALVQTLIAHNAQMKTKVSKQKRSLVNTLKGGQ